jgi:hypothetical protein
MTRSLKSTAACCRTIILGGSGTGDKVCRLTGGKGMPSYWRRNGRISDRWWMVKTGYS